MGKRDTLLKNAGPDPRETEEGGGERAAPSLLPLRMQGGPSMPTSSGVGNPYSLRPHRKQPVSHPHKWRTGRISQHRQ